jgi:hypothetical protein
MNVGESAATQENQRRTSAKPAQQQNGSGIREPLVPAMGIAAAGSATA